MKTKSLAKIPQKFIEKYDLANIKGKTLVGSDDVHEITGYTYEKGVYSGGEAYEYFCITTDQRKDGIGESSIDSYYKIMDIPFSEIKEKAKLAIRGEYDLNQYKQDDKKTMELMSFNKQTYEAYKNKLEKGTKELEAIKKMMHQDLLEKTYEMRELIDEFQKKVLRLNEIIFTIELYLGIEEDLVQLQSGMPADPKTEIYLYQDMMFMDEEVSDPTDGGIDYKDIEKFDNWLLEVNTYYGYHNYNFLVPHEKSVRLLRVRRYEKRYSSDWSYNKKANEENWQTYILIRNGENFYKIQTKMNFGEKMFPNPEELADIFEKVKEEQESYIKSQEDKDKVVEEEINKVADVYKKNMIVMQGLIERTPIFEHTKVNFLEGNQKGVVFKYADKDLIEDGIDHLAWMKEATEVKAGDRVLYYPSRNSRNAVEDGFFRLYCYKSNYPPTPDLGVYTPEADEHGRGYYFKFLPDDTIWKKDKWGGWVSGPRKKRESWKPRI